MAWVCPKCKGQDLNLVVSTEARLIQYDSGEFETEEIGGHEWDDDSAMSCNNCGHRDSSVGFKVEED